ncbi:MAG: SH3 domain-containing protein [Myxococcaceae bacterium]
MKLRTKVVLGALLLVGTGALALNAGAEVYVKAKNTKLLQKPDATSTVVGTLQPGDKVKWQQAANKEFHSVTATNGKTGYVYFSNLSVNPPVTEYVKGTGAVDAKTFATTGAATKALGDGAITYGDQKLNNEDAVKAILAMEAMGQQTSSGEVAEHAKSAGLTPAVKLAEGSK